MAYTFKLQLLVKPEPRIDASKMIGLLIGLLYSSNGVDYVQIPGYMKKIYINADYLKTVLDMPDGTAPQKTAKNNALKDLIRSYPEIKCDDQELNWNIVAINQFVTNYDLANVQTQRLDTYIKVTLGLTYPISFNL